MDNYSKFADINHTCFKEIKRVICDPKLFDEISDEDKKIICETYEGKIGQSEYVLNHTNYLPAEALKHILPEGEEGKSACRGQDI